MVNEYCIIFENQKLIDDICKDVVNTGSLFTNYEMRFNLEGNKEDKIKFCHSISNDLANLDSANISSIDVDREEFYIANGCFIFLGCF